MPPCWPWGRGPPEAWGRRAEEPPGSRREPQGLARGQKAEAMAWRRGAGPGPSGAVRDAWL